MIDKITLFLANKFYLKSLDTTGLKPTNQNSIKVPKVFKPKKGY